MRPVLPFALVAGLAGAALPAQSTAIFPADYVNVPEGPLSSPNYPLANGTSRVMILYESWDLPIPAGASIQRLGFREDTTLTTMDQGQALQLEVRMGYTANGASNISSTFANNYSAPPTTVFGPALFTLPALRDPNNPLPNGRLWIPLSTAFPYDPSNGNLLVEYRIFGNSAGGSRFNYRLDRADFYSPTANGTAGCQHSGGSTAALDLQPVRIGTNFTARVLNGPANSFALLLLAVDSQLRTPFPLQALLPTISPACQGEIDLTAPLALSGLTASSGAKTWFFTVPNQVMPWNDMFVSCQVALFDFFSPGGVVVSNGSQVQIGIPPPSTILAQGGPPTTVTTGSLLRGYCPVALFEYQ